VFRVLIVEDEEKTAEQLKSIISDHVEDVQVHTAADVPEGRRLILAAKAAHKPYHVVVLDMMLPPEVGHQAQLDVSLCEAIQHTMQHTLVAHVTAYDQDDAVRTHLDVAHESRPDLSFRLTKGRGFAKSLLERLRPFLYGLRIEQQLDTLFISEVATGYPAEAVMKREVGGARSKTHELAALMRDISSHWEFLDEGLKTRICDIFRVTEHEGDGVTVSLF
jgi:CheY-like chemotaxis protein